MRLKSLLDKARVTSQTQDVVFYAADGYSDSLTIERAMKDNIMVAYRMNSSTLSLGPWISGQNDRTWALRHEVCPVTHGNRAGFL